MEIDDKYSVNQDGVYQLLEDVEYFKKFFQAHYRSFFQRFNIKCDLEVSYLEEAHTLWMRDNAVVVFRNSENITTPNHFKNAGILAYWLKRLSPIHGLVPPSKNAEILKLKDIIPVEYYSYLVENVIEDNDLEGLSELDVEYREILYSYPREYPPFKINYNICRYIEGNKKDFPEVKESDFSMDIEYQRDLCAILREKHVSPHSLMVIYRTLFK